VAKAVFGMLCHRTQTYINAQKFVALNIISRQALTKRKVTTHLQEAHDYITDVCEGKNYYFNGLSFSRIYSGLCIKVSEQNVICYEMALFKTI
jgi:hypothetical protein